MDLKSTNGAEVGDIIQLKSEQDDGITGNVLLLGENLPENDPVNFQTINFPLADGVELLKGNVISHNDSYFILWVIMLVFGLYEPPT